jgi:hypothetical protein
MRALLPFIGCLILLTGCNAIPDVVHQPTFHNPFPQLERVAVLPFNNLSDNPYVDGDLVARAYFQQLQNIPGFVVVPLERVKTVLRAHTVELATVDDIQELGRQLHVDAVVVGAVTDFDPYYPPRLGLAVDWYATNPGFHPIPPGYGLPWGRAEEEYIPEAIVRDAEFALAKAQLQTQTPVCPEPPRKQSAPATAADTLPSPTAGEDRTPAPGLEPGPLHDPIATTATTDAIVPFTPDLPANWPDPRGFVPPPPSPLPPPCILHHGPIIEHVRMYDGTDSDLTTALADYYYFADDARFGGWQAYLQRSEDFIRFCCYLSITEMLAARGGAGQTRVVWRWPISRYER